MLPRATVFGDQEKLDDEAAGQTIPINMTVNEWEV